MQPAPAPPRRQLDDRQRLAWLRLIRSENVGPVTFREVLNFAGGAEKALERLPELARRGGRSMRIATVAEAEAELAAAARCGARLVAIDEPDYPPLLCNIDVPPPLLYVQGRSDVLARPAVAIVGSRDASAAGRRITQLIATDLGRAGITVVSGLARGIDATAHETALGTGTVAVVAGGINVIYPPEHADLHRRIATEGLLIAENPPGFEPRGRDFPRRNRIVSGMSHGVLVVEAASRSGSRITAQCALDQNREVFAVPGNPLDPRAAGTNQLIKDGATLVTDAADILAVIGPMIAQLTMPGQFMSPPSVAAEGLRDYAGGAGAPGSERDRILAALGPAPLAMDDIARALGLDIRHIRIVALELELAGRLERHAGQRISLRPA